MRPRKKNAHLPRCVHLHHGAYYYVKANKWTPLGKSLPAALAKYGQIVEGPKHGVGKLVEEALPVITRGVKPNTASQYRIAGKKLSTALSAFEPAQVLPKHLAEIKRAMASKPNMANRVLTVARLVFNYALETGQVSINPAVGVKRHKEAKRDRLPTVDEVEAIKGNGGRRLAVVVDLLRFTGQRLNDVLRIRETDLLPEGISFRQQKTGAYLIVKWNAGLTAAVESARGLPGYGGEWLLPSRWKGKPPDSRSVRYQWEKACKAAGVKDLHLHDLRALAATQARREGKDAQALLGHATATQTATYLRDRLARVVDAPEF